jgi:hypothetical protein
MRNRVRSAGGLAAGGVIRTEEHRRQDRRRYMETMRTIALLALSASLAQAAVLPRLRVSENGRFFIQEGGAPFLYLGDTEWTLLQCTRDDVDTYLADRAAKKFTVVQISVAGFDALKKMFVDGDPARPNEEYFRFLDYVVRKAESVGLYVALAPMWSNGYVRPELNVLNDATAFSYGKYLGTRYRDTSVIWILGGDFFATGFEDIWRRMAAGLTEGDGGVHLRTYHPKSPRSSAQWFHAEKWLDFNMLQTGHTTLNRNYDLVAEDWARVPVKPVVDGEGGYEGIADGLAPGLTIAAHDVRRIAYSAIFAGAAGYTYGGHGVWGYRSNPATAAPPPQPAGAPNRHGPAPPWKEALQLPAGRQMQYLRALMESRPMLVRIPDQWLIANDPLGTTERMEACRGSDGSYAFIYTATGRKLKIRLIDGPYPKLSGKTIRGWWYDPRLGTSTAIGEFEKTGFKDFTPPSSGPGNDWVLVLDDASKNFPAPGKGAAAR